MEERSTDEPARQCIGPRGIRVFNNDINRLSSMGEMMPMCISVGDIIGLEGSFKDIIVPAVFVAAALHAPANGSQKTAFIVPSWHVKRGWDTIHSTYDTPETSERVPITMHDIKNEATDRIIRHVAGSLSKDVSPDDFVASFWESATMITCDSTEDTEEAIKKVISTVKPGFLFVGIEYKASRMSRTDEESRTRIVETRHSIRNDLYSWRHDGPSIVFTWSMSKPMSYFGMHSSIFGVEKKGSVLNIRVVDSSFIPPGVLIKLDLDTMLPIKVEGYE